MGQGERPKRQNTSERKAQAVTSLFVQCAGSLQFLFSRFLLGLRDDCLRDLEAERPGRHARSVWAARGAGVPSAGELSGREGRATFVHSRIHLKTTQTQPTRCISQPPPPHHQPDNYHTTSRL